MHFKRPQLATIRSLLAGMAISALLVMGAPAIARDLVVALKTEPTSLDPQYHNFFPNIQVSLTMFDPLICTDGDLALKPCLAQTWSSQGNVWTFKLRPDVKFSDGSDFTAQDVIFTFDRVAQVPNSPSSFSLFLQHITKIEALDPLTVQITTDAPYPLLPINMTMLPIMSSKAASGLAPEGKTTVELNAGTGLVGTGPYRFVTWKRGSELVLERNPNYWGNQPEWDTVIMRPISNPAARIAALQAGDVDLVEDPPTDDLKNLRNNSRLSVITKPSIRVIYVALDQHNDQTPGITGTHGKNPLLDHRVREAMSLALDRQALVDRIMGGIATPAGQLLPSNMFGASPQFATAPKANIERAKALLTEAGYPNGFTLVLGSPNGRYINDSKVAQTLAAMWSRIGIKTSVDAVTPSIFFKKRDAYEYSAYLAGWGTSSGEMSNVLNSLVVTSDKERGVGTTNRSRYSNPDMDKLVAASASEMDDAKRSALLQQASEIAMKDYAILPIHFEHSVWAMKSDLEFSGRADQMTLVQHVTSKK